MLAVVGSLSAVKGVKYAGVFIVGIWWGGGLQRLAHVLALAKKGRLECMVAWNIFCSI